jgi:putative addiction module killer protein
MEKEVIFYRTQEGKEPYKDWLYSLNDRILRYRIETREHRIRYGNYGDHKHFHSIIELRLDFGKGYRIYCGEDGHKLVILLIGGDKASQDKDIEKAREYWRDYNEYKKI